MLHCRGYRAGANHKELDCTGGATLVGRGVDDGELNGGVGEDGVEADVASVVKDNAVEAQNLSLIHI